MFKFKRLHTKLFVSILLVVLIPLIGLGIFSYVTPTWFLEEETLLKQQQTTRLVGENIGLLLNDARDISDFIVNNETVQSVLSQADLPNDLVYASQTFTYLSNLKKAKSYITFIVIYGENGFLYKDFTSYFRVINPYPLIKESPSYIATAAMNGDLNWMYSSSPLFLYQHKYPEIMLGRRVISSYDPDIKLGMMFMGFSKDTLNDLIQEIDMGKSTNILLFDKEYNLVSSKSQYPVLSRLLDTDIGIKRELLEQTTSQINIDGTLYLTSISRIDPFNWYIASLAPMDIIRGQHENILRLTLLLTVVLLLMTGIISILLSRSITLPIKRLLHSMSSFKRGDFHQIVAVRTSDEIGLLSQKYNEMVAELNKLIHTVYVQETHQRLVELRTLQAQIEPHFLYNTLDFIFLNSKMNGDKQTADVVFSLSELFRLSLNKGKDYYELGKEIVQIKAYLQIQHARFPNRFEPEYRIDPDIEKYIVLKLLLQPIVENAILHAFNKNLNRKGMLIITGHIHDGHICLTVEDNGKGMSEYQIEGLFKNTMHRTGYGLWNVNERLQIVFGTTYGLEISSTMGFGTSVRMKLPLVENEEEWRQRYESNDRG